MKVLAETSFREFVHCPFFEDFYTEDKEGRDVFEAPGAKIVLCTEDCGYGQYLHAFYRKSPSGRWIKKLEFSDEQLEDAVVRLIGDEKTGDPDYLLFIIGSAEFEFVLTNDMAESLKQMLDDGFGYYFPDYEYTAEEFDDKFFKTHGAW